MEHEQDSADAAGGAGVSRGQNQLHVLPVDWYAAESAIEPLLERLQPETSAAQLLIVASDPEAVAGIASRVAPAARAGERRLRTSAVTDSRRAARIQRYAPAHVLIGAAPALVELLQAALLKLDGVRAVVLAWVDELDPPNKAALETLMAELPKDAARVIIANAVTPGVEELVERYARRARRAQAAAAEARPAVSLSYVTVSEAGRLAALRRLLDALDPESAFVLVRSAESRSAVEGLLQSLGYGPDADAIRVGDSPNADARLIVLFDLVTNDEELRRLVAERASSRVVALVTPRQLASLRRLAGGSVSPLQLPEAATRARTREAALREELRAMLDAGQYSRELLAIEPLLSDFDGVEIAAAALRLLEAGRAQALTAPAATSPGAMTRLYLNVGSMDNVRPGDLVGAITNEAGISKNDMGKVDIRERHSTVEVSTAVANNVVSKITGVSVRGRRVVARVDEERERPPRPRRDDVRLGSGGARRERRPPRDRK